MNFIGITLSLFLAIWKCWGQGRVASCAQCLKIYDWEQNLHFLFYYYCGAGGVGVVPILFHRSLHLKQKFSIFPNRKLGSLPTKGNGIVQFRLRWSATETRSRRVCISWFYSCIPYLLKIILSKDAFRGCIVISLAHFCIIDISKNTVFSDWNPSPSTISFFTVPSYQVILNVTFGSWLMSFHCY